MVATPELATQGDARRLVIDAGGGGRIDLSGLDGIVARDILNGAFRQIGDDLLLENGAGHGIVIKDYFAHPQPADLVLDGAARLDGSLVARLAQPGAPALFADSNQFANDAVQIAQAGDSVGSVESITGSVNVQRGGGTVALAEGDPIYQNDVVATGSDGSVGIVFVDGTTFSLSEGARMTIDEMVYDPASGGGSLVTSVLQGAFVFSTGTIAPNGNMEVNTPVGTIGIRGTTVAARIALEGSDTVIVLLADADGHVGRIFFQNAGGLVELTEANTAIFVQSFFIQPSEPTEVTPAQLIEFFDQLLQFHTTGPATQEGAIDEGDVGDLADQLADQLGLGEFALAAGGDPVVETTDSIEQLSEWLGFVPDPLQPVTFTTVDLSGNITTGDINIPGGPNQPGISNDYLDPFSPTAGTAPPPPSLFNFYTGGAGNDVLDASGSGKAAIITGSGGDDTLTGSAFDDLVSGGGGNDTIVGGHGGGNDFYDGGDGDDTVRYASTDEGVTVDLDAGKAWGDPDIGTDKLANIENAVGGSGDDKLIGNGGNNELSGADGADQLKGGGGDDILDGGESGYLGGGEGNSYIEHTDIAIFSGNAADYEIIVVGEGGYVEVHDLRDGSPDGTDTLYNMEIIRFADQDVWVDDLNGGENHAPTNLTLSNTLVPENQQVVGAIGVEDPDEDSFSFTVSDERFAIIGNQLVLQEGYSFDFEGEETTIQITVTATDSSGMSVSKDFVLTVGDENDAPELAVDTDSTTPNAVVEGAAAGTYTGITAKAADQDAGDTVSYELSDDADGRFEIDPVTGRVTVTEDAHIDAEGEGAGPYQITVKATDSEGGHSEQTFEIAVENVNEAPSEPFDIDWDTPDQVSENAETGATVGIRAESYDRDAGDEVTYSLASDFDGLFTIDAVTGIVSIANASKLDYETKSGYDLTVIATDKGGLSSQSTFQIAVTDADEPPSAPKDIDPAANEILEGAVGNAYSGIQLDATDPDAGSQSVTFEVVGEYAGLFYVDSENRVYSEYYANFDYETQSTYDITIRATSGDLSSEQTFTVNIGNVAEGGDDGQIIWSEGTLIVGKDAFGQLTLSGEESEQTVRTVIGQEAGGDGTILVSGPLASLWANPQGITIGDAGKGHLIVEDGGTVDVHDPIGQNNRLVIGKQEGSEGRVDVSGGYEGWDGQPFYNPSDIMLTGHNNTIIVGQDGKGTLHIEDGAIVSALNMEIGYGETGIGTVTVEGEGGLLHLSTDNGKNTTGELEGTGGFLRIGRLDGSEGSLNILDGGTVRVTHALADKSTIPGVTIAEEIGSKGSLLIDGPQSELIVSGYPEMLADPLNEHDTLQGPWITIGEQGEASAIVTNGGQIELSGNEVYLGVGGGNFQDPDDTTPTPLSTLTISDGGYVLVQETMGNSATNQAGVYIGDMANGNGKIVVTGTESLLHVAGGSTALVVGHHGTGELEIEAGGAVTANRLIVGDTGTGTLSATGAGSALNVLGSDSYISIAHSAGSNGEMLVADGAQVNGLDLVVGRGGEGSLTITGDGTTVTMSSKYGRYSEPEIGMYESGFVRVGQQTGSTGLLSVLAGASLLITNDTDGQTSSPGMQIGLNDKSSGEVVVSGAGSNLSIIENAATTPLDMGPYLAIGVEGQGQMRVLDGASVTVAGDNAFVGISQEIGGSGSLYLSGAETSFTVSGENARLELGRFYEGVGNSSGGISVVSGATLTVNNTNPEPSHHIFINDGSFLEIAGGTVNGGVSLTGGTLFAGYFGIGTINGDVLLAEGSIFDSTLQVGVIGAGANHGKLVVNGNFSIEHGTIAFHFADGYNPVADSTFTFLTANQIILGSYPANDPADISLAAFGVSQFFKFGIEATSSSISFHALDTSTGGDSIVFRGGDQDDRFGGEDSKGYAYLSGGGGDDWLVSNYGAVGDGRHIIHGGKGADLMQGFGDSDEFYVWRTSDNFSVGNDGVRPDETHLDRIVEFDTSADKITFDQFYAGENGWGFESGFDPAKFIVLDEGVTYNDFLDAGNAAYDSENPVLILEQIDENQFNLIYDGNGAGEGYTIVAQVTTTGGNFTVDNVGISQAST